MENKYLACLDMKSLCTNTPRKNVPNVQKFTKKKKKKKKKKKNQNTTLPFIN